MMTLSIIDFVVAWDKAATLWMNAHTSPAMDPFWMFMSGIKVWIPMYVAVAALLIWRLGWKKGLIAVAAALLAFALSEQVNNFIKFLVERVRPCNDPDMIAAGIRVLEEGGGWSFPSGHSNNSFTFAVCTALLFKAEIMGLGRVDTSSSLRRKRISRGVRRFVNCYGIFIISWAVLVAISRVMVARHFLLDVTVGGLIGVCLGVVFSRIAWIIFSKVK